MPLTPDLGMVMQKDRVAVDLQPCGVALEVEIKFGQGDDVGFGQPALVATTFIIILRHMPRAIYLITPT